MQASIISTSNFIQKIKFLVMKNLKKILEFIWILILVGKSYKLYAMYSISSALVLVFYFWLGCLHLYMINGTCMQKRRRICVKVVLIDKRDLTITHNMKRAWPWMLANPKIICQFHTHPVHQNSVDIFWAEIYRGRLFRVASSLIQSNSRCSLRDLKS